MLTRQAIVVFERALRDLGYVEGKNLVVEYRFADRGIAQLPELAAELVRQKVDIIVTDGTPATHAAKGATTTIPIVMVVSAAPVEQGFVESLARPGGNITGLSMLLPELAKKRVELFKELMPNAKRVAVLGRADDRLQPPATREAATELNLGLIALEIDIRSPDYERAFDAAIRGRADGLVVQADAIFARDRAQIVALAAQRRLPIVYFERLFADVGGLMSYGTSINEMFRRSASYVDRILRGAKPADLPVEQPAEFELVLNPTTAKTLGIEFPPSLWSRADARITTQ